MLPIIKGDMLILAQFPTALVPASSLSSRYLKNQLVNLFKFYLILRSFWDILDENTYADPD